MCVWEGASRGGGEGGGQQRGSAGGRAKEVWRRRQVVRMRLKMLVGPNVRLRLRRLHFSQMGVGLPLAQIALIPRHRNHNPLRTLLLQLSYPVLQRLQWRAVRGG